jgi:hypothetical protein
MVWRGDPPDHGEMPDGKTPSFLAGPFLNRRHLRPVHEPVFL